MNCVSRSQPSLGHDDEVLDPDAAALVRQVDTRLDGDDVARLEEVRRLGTQRGRLVDLQPDAVPHPVPVRRAVSGGVDDGARSCVRIPPVHARCHRGESGELRLEAERVQLLQRPQDLAHRERARAVRAVAVDDATCVDRDEDTRLDRSVARHGMRRRGGRARGHHRFEREPVCSCLPEAPLDPPRELLLTPAAEALPRERREDLVGEPAGASHDRDLLRVLDGPQPLDEAGARNRVDPGVDERAVERVREVLLLELDPPAGEQLADRGDEATRDLGHVETVERARAIRVAEVRVQGRAPVGLDQHCRVRALQAGEVADVRLPAEDVRRPRDEKRLLEERRESPESAHDLLPTMNSSACR